MFAMNSERCGMKQLSCSFKGFFPGVTEENHETTFSEGSSRSRGCILLSAVIEKLRTEGFSSTARYLKAFAFLQTINTCLQILPKSFLRHLYQQNSENYEPIFIFGGEDLRKMRFCS